MQIPWAARYRSRVWSTLSSTSRFLGRIIFYSRGIRRKESGAGSRYHPAAHSAETALGGDLLCAVETPARVVVVIGQVLGHQLQAVVAPGRGLWLVGPVRPDRANAAEKDFHQAVVGSCPMRVSISLRAAFSRSESSPVRGLSSDMEWYKTGD